ncbi:MAG TPA: lipoate--protein ligase family protein [bacterium]|nr:lipoate--protein ligase family protein [bacterium]
MIPGEREGAASRFIDDGALPGAENMARDLALLDRAIAGEGPFLRVYSWARPTLSLGYFQSEEDVAEAGAAGRLGVDITRRFTGGGAILHHHELTFSVALPPSHPLARLGVNESYLEITRPLLEILRGRGLEARFRGDSGPEVKAANCFAGSACPDVVVGGRKLFGSAQRRRQGAVLQHGSLLLDLDAALWSSIFGPRLGEGFISLSQAKPGLSLDWPAELRQAYQAVL